MNLRNLRATCCTLLTVALAVAGCAQNGGAARKTRAEPHVSPAAARTEQARPRIEAPPPPAKLPVVPSRGTCAPPADNLTFFGSCCNDTPCIGQCVAAGEDKIACACFGVAGGCQQGQICCKIRRGCTLPKDCEAP